MLRGTVRPALFSWGRMYTSVFLMSSVCRLASSEMRIPVCKRSSTTADILISRRTASRREEYSAGGRMRGAEDSYLGWANSEAGLVGVRLF
ncbi:MAG: hypothetical protein UY11_C0023G0010 [Candidatus Amesbacteria bacterium GW2011_GWC2_47_8]|uniref:Uncharacterized protein n=1 Tax=Candidatus Amesbacteria bacterium GW2011_GWC2_47_8 TaxID=1618367 RepID=A0A0G1TN91_9BACT|nr:MAG: hypothetical protein UY11_C0023G0010 [Candidatus Amesbacteria bacterium GW2011_GWC2_47_8]